MSKSMLSPSWYRVADLTPRIRSHAQFHRQRFRGQTWYILQDNQSGQFLRLSPAAYWMICRMDGRRTVREIWDQLSERLEDTEEQPTQDETIQLLAQLHNADLLHGTAPPDMEEVDERSRRMSRRQLLMRIKNPMAVRIPVLDPDKFLNATYPFVRPIFSRIGFILWLAFVAFGVVLGVLHWDALFSDVVATAFSAQNLLLIFITYPIVKAIHELGHGYAAKAWGGEVHEMGIMFLILMPVPYVDASSASAFQKKSRRIIVSCAGIMVEAMLATIAMIVWVLAEPGLARSLAFNVVLIGGGSTLLFNGNPLLRFDGYYAFADYLEIPNLATRANKYFFHVIKKDLFKVEAEESPVSAPGEAGWFLFYSVASFLYRIFIMIGIALFIANQLFFIGILLAMMTIFTTLVLPVGKGIKYLMTSPALRHRRRRALSITAGAAVSLIVLIGVVPLPYATSVQGVVQLPEQSSVPIATNGFVSKLLVESGSYVDIGTPLVQLEDPELSAQYALQKQELDELKLRERAEIANRLAQARVYAEQIRLTEANLSLTEQRLADLTIKAERSGRFIVPGSSDLPGRFARQGDILGYIIAEHDPVVRVVVPQSDIDLVRNRTQWVEARRVEQIDRVIEAQIIREVPLAQTELPSPALGTQGGGDIILDPQSVEQQQALEALFNFDLALLDQPSQLLIGSRVHVRFDHGMEPIVFRAGRAVRQLFLRQFGV